MHFDALSDGIVMESPLAFNPLAFDLVFPPGTLDVAFHPCFGQLGLSYQIDVNSSHLWITPSETCALGCRSPLEKAELCAERSHIDTFTSKLALSFADALYKVDAFVLDEGGDRMELLDAEGTVLIHLISCQVESDLAGTSWHPTLIHTQANGTISPLCMIDALGIYANFDRCSIRGSAGCNSYGGVYKTLDNGIRIGNTARTLVDCAGGSIEYFFMQSLHLASTFEISNDKKALNLFDSNGTELVSFMPCDKLDLTDTVWETHCIRNLCGTSVGGKVFTLEFARNNILRGHTKCSETFEMEYKSYPNGNIAIVTSGWNATDCSRESFDEEVSYEKASEEEAEFPLALAEAVYFSIIPCYGALALFNEEGDILLLAFHKTPPDDLQEECKGFTPASSELETSSPDATFSPSEGRPPPTALPQEIFESSVFGGPSSATKWLSIVYLNLWLLVSLLHLG